MLQRLVLVLLLSCICLGDYKTHEYTLGDEVPVFMNTVGPYKNPTETYGYYEKLPFCKPKVLKHRIETLGEVLEGNRLASSGYDVHFLEKMETVPLCEIEYDEEQIALFKKAIDEVYYFHLLVDDLPVWNFIGSTDTDEENPTYFLYTHLAFYIEFNEGRIVRANVSVAETPETYVALEGAMTVSFTYSVSWVENKEIEFHDRMKQYAASQLVDRELEIHWFSILNSVVLVILLTGFLFVILMRVLKSDYVRYSSVEDQELEEIEEFGWKLIHGDVFRFPNHKMILSSILGVGSQFLVIVSGVLILGGIGLYYPYNRGSMKTSLVLLYAFTSFVAGYTASSFYKKIGGEKWVWNIVLTSTLFPVPLFLIWSILNSVAWAYHSTQALPFGTILVLILIWLLVGFPLTVIGGITGKNNAGEFYAPCRTRNIPREIPPAPWYHMLFVQMVMSGFLPFSAISIELYYIFVAIWGHKLYTLYGILIIVFLILLIVTSFITIAFIYFQLSTEDYRWWWRATFNGGSTSFFIYLYAVFFYLNRSSMSGLLQSSFFFGYVLIACYACFLMLATIGFFSALTFIRYIYKNFKTD